MPDIFEAQQQAIIAHLTATILGGALAPWLANDRELTAAHDLAVRIYNMSGTNRWMAPIE